MRRRGGGKIADSEQITDNYVQRSREGQMTMNGEKKKGGGIFIKPSSEEKRGVHAR